MTAMENTRANLNAASKKIEEAATANDHLYLKLEEAITAVRKAGEQEELEAITDIIDGAKIPSDMVKALQSNVNRLYNSLSKRS